MFPLTSYHKEQRNKDGRKTDCPPCRAKESAKRKEARTGQTTPGRAGRPKGSGSASPDVLAALRSSGTAVSDDDWADILGHIVKRAREGHRPGAQALGGLTALAHRIISRPGRRDQYNRGQGPGNAPQPGTSGQGFT